MTSTTSNYEGPAEGPFLFIVNPNAGGKTYPKFKSTLQSLVRHSAIQIVESESADHSIQLAKEAVSNGFKGVVAVGGDGSVHEIGVQLIGQPISLGIIPTGSGNGVARHLGISMNIKKAFEQILSAKSRTIDTLTLNNRAVIGFCGIGIDAAVAKAFDDSKERGFSNYVKLTIDAFTKYQPSQFTIISEGKPQAFKAYSVIVANISQLGNNAYVNPTGKDDDGLMDVIIIKAFPPQALLPLASRLFLKSILASKWVHHFQTRKLEVINHAKAYTQVDGEPWINDENLTFEIKPQSLTVLTP